MIRPLDNQERVNPPEYPDRIMRLERRPDAEPRDFALRVKEAIREKEEKDESKKQKKDEGSERDSIELSSTRNPSASEPDEESPAPKPKSEAIDLIV